MEASPNVLNKILPCLRLIPLHFNYSTAGRVNSHTRLGWQFDAATDEKMYMWAMIPKWIKAGADVVVKIRGWPQNTNDTGADKVVCLTSRYNIIGKSGVAPDQSNGDIIQITIPDGEPAFTIHCTDLLTVSGLTVDDFLGITVIRDADNPLDTWATDWFILEAIYLEIIGDKIGQL